MGKANDEPGFIAMFFTCILFGVGAALAIYLLAQVLDFIGCFCTCGKAECFTHKSCTGEMGLYKEGVAQKIFGFLLIAGAGIGLVAGIVSQIQKNDKIRIEEAEEEAERRKTVEEKRRQEEEERRKVAEANSKAAQELRQEIANEFQSELGYLMIHCDENVKTSETWVMKPTYEAVAVQKDVWNAVDEASVPLQRLDDIVSELKAKASGGGK